MGVGAAVVLGIALFLLLCAGDWLASRLRSGFLLVVGHYGLLTAKGARFMANGYPEIEAAWADYRKVHLGPVWLVLGRRWKVPR
jgi:hypothetical protein